jgi:hypothetical protein
MRSQDLEKFLNQFELLRGISLIYPEGMSQLIAPQLMLLTGMINIHGVPHLFESEINLNDFKTHDDCMRLAKAMLQAFDKAEEHNGRTN